MLTTLSRLVRRHFNTDVKHVIYLQSCVRRRLARKQLKALRQEARSVNKFKEISYRLENKVVELTQNLQTRTQEKKELQGKLSILEQQLQNWQTRHEEADARGKQLQADLVVAQAIATERDELIRQKDDVQKQLEATLVIVEERDSAVQKLETEIARQAAQLEAQLKQIETAPPRVVEDSSVIATLKSEVNNLREQLNRSYALNALTKGARDAPTSPTFAPTLRALENHPTNGTVNGGPPPVNGTSAGRHQRRHSSAGVYGISPADYRTSADELMTLVKRSQNTNPRAVSVAYNGEDGLPRMRAQNGLSNIYDDPAEEKIRLLQDIKHLDEDVLDGLIKGLKIPLPSLTNPSAVKEILFPANLISLVTNEMWKYGLIPESERFLANVMQTVQAHVMVRRSVYCVGSFLIMPDRVSLERMLSYPVSIGFPTSMRCSHSSASPSPICCKASDLVKRTRCVHSTGRITRDLSLSSNMTWTVSSTTSTTRG